ncbi:MAG: HAD-IA family hydrolase [Bryobacteraceae bacterium]
MSHPRFRMLYSDIGGVLGTNGWDGRLRTSLCAEFGLEVDEVERRHHLMFDSFERGFLTFDEYLARVVFFAPRDFTLEQIREFAFAASEPWPENLEFFRHLRIANTLGFALISNEGQGITQHRVKKFGLRRLCDYMVISHFTGLRKPDREIWKLALDLAQVQASESIYVDDREMFVEAAREIGFTTIHHTSLETTREHFARLGLLEKRDEA